MHDASLAKLWHVPEGEAANKYRLSRQIYGQRSCPAYVLHGDAGKIDLQDKPRAPVIKTAKVLADSCVGVEQADEVVGAMLGCGIEVVYERPHGKDHFLDTPPDYENEAFYSFLLKHV